MRHPGVAFLDAFSREFKGDELEYEALRARRCWRTCCTGGPRPIAS